MKLIRTEEVEKELEDFLLAGSLKGKEVCPALPGPLFFSYFHAYTTRLPCPTNDTTISPMGGDNLHSMSFCPKGELIQELRTNYGLLKINCLWLKSCQAFQFA